MRSQYVVFPVLVGLLVLGCFLCVRAVRTSDAVDRFRRRAAPATGTIVELVDRSRRRYHEYDAPVHFARVRFVTAQGREVVGESMFGSNPPPGLPGRQVEILYDPERPERILLRSGLSSGKPFSWALGGLGIFLVLFSLLLLGLATLVYATVGLPV